MLVHGATVDHTNWQSLLPYLEPHVTVHAMDRRGRGGSGDAPAYDVAREFEDVAAVVDAIAHTAGAAVDVLGHSYGGECVWGATRLTSELRRLVLYEGWPPSDPDAVASYRVAAEGLEPLLAAGDREFALEMFYRQVASLTEDELRAVKAQPTWPARVAAVDTSIRELRSSVVLDPAQAIQVSVPVLMLIGGDSPDALKADPHTVAAALPDARIEVLEGQQHIAHRLVPETFATCSPSSTVGREPPVGYGRAMDADAALDVLGDAASDLADAVADLDRIVPTYPGWTVADLVVHTGRIHRWVAEIVASRAAQRLPQPELGQRPDHLLEWFRAGAARVIDTLAAISPTTPVWTFAGEPTAGFWRRRMALETTIHRWDAQRAAGITARIADAVAVAGVSEALEIYVEPRLRGADVGGRCEIVSLRAADGVAAWTVRLRPDAIDVLTDDPPADVRVEAVPADLWLFLMGRAGREVLDVHGPVSGVERLQRAVALLPAPAG